MRFAPAAIIVDEVTASSNRVDIMPRSEVMSAESGHVQQLAPIIHWPHTFDLHGFRWIAQMYSLEYAEMVAHVTVECMGTTEFVERLADSQRETIPAHAGVVQPKQLPPAAEQP